MSNLISLDRVLTQSALPARVSIAGMTLTKRDSMSIGEVRPESISFSIASMTTSDWEPTADKVASRDFHLLTLVGIDRTISTHQFGKPCSRSCCEMLRRRCTFDWNAAQAGTGDRSTSA